ncbi:hypothetical protein AAC387_Pa06g1481 [Persea americana]
MEKRYFLPICTSVSNDALSHVKRSRHFILITYKRGHPSGSLNRSEESTEQGEKKTDFSCEIFAGGDLETRFSMYSLAV